GNVFDPTASDTGTYVLQFSLLNQPPPGCPSDFTVTVHVDPAVNAGVATQPVAFCSGDDQLVNLNGLITGADANGTWTETSLSPSQGIAFNPTSGTFETDNQVPGTYRFKYILESNGACPDDETEVSVVINALPTAVATDNVVIDCINPIQSLDANGSSFGSQYEITWTGPGILADGNENTLHPSIDQAGLYVLTIKNTLTGCSSTASVTVTANTDPPTDALINSHDPACFGEQNGFIHLDQVIGGEAPYVFSLNNNPFSANTDYDNLSAGSYDLVVEDDNGCRWDTTIILVEPATIQIDIGPDIELDLGESGSVQAIINLPSNQIDTLIWEPTNVIACIDVSCLEVNVHAFYSTMLSATVTDINGCQSTDELNIVVDSDRELYIPTVFSPNGDGTNDNFYIIGDEHQIVKVKQFTIFNRWGGIVHEALNFLPNDPAYGWDGNEKGKGVNPGVFTYVAEIEFIDKIVLRYVGDVTVVR
ncbi:MAG TPA: gliding motility-associated C-terminal domain-containing protein, partial [Bacteroidota bacterium]|nr:gliding motility-associated C-terminal domain-containing protein [Bacteroidota bacterium]